eukprot:scaffold28813_cov35-Tisochrysis_lutea.AAC.1
MTLERFHSPRCPPAQVTRWSVQSSIGVRLTPARHEAKDMATSILYATVAHCRSMRSTSRCNKRTKPRLARPYPAGRATSTPSPAPSSAYVLRRRVQRLIGCGQIARETRRHDNVVVNEGDPCIGSHGFGLEEAHHSATAAPLGAVALNHEYSAAPNRRLGAGPELRGALGLRNEPAGLIGCRLELTPVRGEHLARSSGVLGDDERVDAPAVGAQDGDAAAREHRPARRGHRSEGLASPGRLVSRECGDVARRDQLEGGRLV